MPRSSRRIGRGSRRGRGPGRLRRRRRRAAVDCCGGEPAAGRRRGRARLRDHRLPGDLDPLDAATTSAQLVSRQVFEPLVATLDGPYGRHRDATGLALSARSSGDFRVWSLRLRGGVRFQDGRLLNASAVVANARALAHHGPGAAAAARAWSPPTGRGRTWCASSSRGRSRNVPSRLSDPRLGLVSPAALRPQSGNGADLARAGQAGSGPFQMRSEPEGDLTLTRNRGWWAAHKWTHCVFVSLIEVRFFP